MTETNISTKKCAKCKSILPLTSFNKNKSKFDGLGTECRPCANAHSKKYHSENLDAHKARLASYKQRNPEKFKEWYKKQYAESDKEAEYLRKKQDREANPEKWRAYSHVYWARHTDICRERKRQYRRKFPEIGAEQNRARQTRQINAMPVWADRKAMKAIYAASKKISRETGIKHHVDHYFPLKSDVVCGLHNEFNLRIIPAVENLSKGNSFPEDNQ
ncbi:MAG TPA: hypothetical protein VF616_27205 [Duganella sp.]|uniref:hypothetical protein n=1 Tax=Duganella sp. TaxID=1904440 RepID=UPI002ED15855